MTIDPSITILITEMEIKQIMMLLTVKPYVPTVTELRPESKIGENEVDKLL